MTTLELKKEKQDAITAALQLGYGHECAAKIEKAESVIEISRILKTARDIERR